MAFIFAHKNRITANIMRGHHCMCPLTRYVRSFRVVKFRKKENRTGVARGRGRRKWCCDFMGAEFPFAKIQEFHRWMLAIVPQQWECTVTGTERQLKWNSVLCIFYPNSLNGGIPDQRQTLRGNWRAPVATASAPSETFPVGGIHLAGSWLPGQMQSGGTQIPLWQGSAHGQAAGSHPIKCRHHQFQAPHWHWSSWTLKSFLENGMLSAMCVLPYTSNHSSTIYNHQRDVNVIQLSHCIV